MKSKFIGAVLCLAALAATFWLIHSFPTYTPAPEEEEPITQITIENSIPSVENTSRSFVITAAHDAENLLTRLAYGEDKNFETSLRDLVLRLDRSGEYLKDQLQDYYGAAYFAKVADVLEDIITNPFTGSADFNTRVSKLLIELEHAYPAEIAETLHENHPETPMYYPKFDTDANGVTSLAMLSVFRQQYQKRTGSVLLTLGGNLVTGDTLLGGEGEKSFKNQAAQSKYPFPLYKVSSVLATDTASFANFQSPLTTSIGAEASLVKGQPEYAGLLKKGSLEMLSLSSPSLSGDLKNDTIKALNEAGLSYTDEGSVSYVKTDLGTVAYLTYDIIDEISGNVNLTYADAPKADIATAKAAGAKFVVVHFNWVNTFRIPAEPSTSQVKTARAAIDNGANLVFGSGPNLAEGLEQYKGATIVYSAGDLSAKGESPSPSFLFQQAFTLDENSNAVPGEILVIPTVAGTEANPAPSLLLDAASASQFEKNIVQWSRSIRYGIGRTSNFTTNALNLISIQK